MLITIMNFINTISITTTATAIGEGIMIAKIQVAESLIISAMACFKGIVTTLMKATINRANLLRD